MSDELSRARVRATTIGDLLLTAADRCPDKTALLLPERACSYAALRDRALLLARALRALDVGAGDHVGLLLPTCMDFTEIMFAAALVGAVTVPINARYRPPEIAYVTENADLKVLFTSLEFADAVDFVGRLHQALPGLAEAPDPLTLDLSTAPKLKCCVILGGGGADGFCGTAQFERLADGVEVDEVHLRRLQTRLGSTALILYTSGTTSNPKGCLISHESMVRNSITLGERYRLTENDKFWSPLPMFHIAAILPLLSIFDVGGTYITAPHFDPGEALEILEREKVTATYPSFWAIMGPLVRHPEFAERDLSSIRLMNANLGVQPPEVGETMEKFLPDVVYVGSFGMTEAAGTVTTGRLDDTRAQRFERLGNPLPGHEVKIVDPESGRELGVGEQGECLIRSYSTFTGYYRSPEKTAEALDDEGWFHSGDICSVDADGQVLFHGRLKDMLKVGGENVAAAEIESCLQEHPGVRLAQVVGVPDDRYQEVAAAFVELKETGGASEDQLIAFCRERIAGFKVPRYVRFVDEWPMSSTKIQKFKLREQLLAELGLS
jgi:acyl-CoA synthetase (AMP-forming)/AMP-acid ligase II